MKIVDFALRHDGSAICIADDGTISEKGAPVAAPFRARKVQVAGDGHVVALDTEGRLWQRIADQVEYLPKADYPGAVQEQRRTAQWRPVLHGDRR